MYREPIALTVLIAICWLSLANGMPTLTGSLNNRDRSAVETGDRLRRQTDYSEDETIVVDAPEIYHDAYALTDDSSADGNLTLRFGYGHYQQYNPFQYGGWNAYGGAGQQYPNNNNNFPGGYPAYPYGPYNYNNYPGSNSTTMNPFYNYNYNNGYYNGYYYPMNTTTTTTTTTSTSTTTRPTSTTTTTRPPYGNYYVFNFRDGSGNQTDIDNEPYAGGDLGQDDGFKFGNR
ncbi:probable ATP-dependent RNA helicase ddx17 [Daphnia carinata]|uniref:probable ATP-dependent RNA helicase ddx17 n=1 Tax=Daphnia carinata TaxID=120202 RepID=UPI00257E7B0D|nr:probable ATP-dependent RNA helicase ddx17 [Daphnia carinata]